MSIDRRKRVFRAVSTEAKSHLQWATTVAFDLDNTLFDTRPRTAKAVHRFAKRYAKELTAGQRTRLSKASLHDVGYDWHETAEKLGIPRRLRPQFERMWTQTFWHPDNLRLDHPIPAMVALVKEAIAAGKNVRFVTGRRQPYRKASVEQLRRVGLEHLAEHLYLKPRGSTPKFKANVVKRWVAQNERVVLIDDSTANIAALGKQRESLRGIAVDFPVNDPFGPRLAPNTATISIAP